jgi:hypothetical protein
MSYQPHQSEDVTLKPVAAEEAAEGVATREWPMPPVKPFRVIRDEAQAGARDAAEKLGAIYQAADAAKGNGNGAT